jgi:transcriptional regulator with XRE-family HTH domain
MKPTKRKALERAGWRFGDAADFLEMSDEERQLLDARAEVALAVRRQRTAQKLTQGQLADRIKSTQPRVVKIEQAASDVSLDQLLRAFTAAGGRILVKKRSTRSSTNRRATTKRANEQTTAIIELQLAEP